MKIIIYIAAIGILYFAGNAYSQNPKVPSITLDTTESVCQRLLTEGSGLKANGMYKEENDTLRAFIEHCANVEGSFHEFTALDGAEQFMSDDNNRWLEYRDWLKKVLYLNLDTLYYCADANSMLETFQYLRPDQGIDWNGAIAVIDYLLQNNRCPDSKAYLLKVRNRDKQIETWRDTVKDSTKTPLDTSAVTLESIGLEILRGQPSSVSATPSDILPSLEDIFVTKNPFTQETSLETTLHEAKMLKLEIYDLLGKKLYDENKFFSEGKVKWTVQGNSLPHETVYARISTIDGKVRSVKLIHE